MFHTLRSKDLDKCEAVDEVPKITEKRWLGAPFHLGPLQSLKVKHENSLQKATSQKCDYYETTMIAAFKNVFFVAKNRIRNLATVTTAALKTHLRVWIEERYRNLQVGKLGGSKSRLKKVFFLSFNYFKTFPQTQDKCAAIANSQRLNLLYIWSWKQTMLITSIWKQNRLFLQDLLVRLHEKSISGCHCTLCLCSPCLNESFRR